MQGRRSNGMYILSNLEGTGNPGPPTPTVMAAQSLNVPVILDTWHRRLGHAGVTAIRNMAKKDLVDGLVIKGDLDVEGLCEDCVYGKHAT
ncbi:hypothetical protein C0991_012361, partial [Blastosporella zonata]